MDFHGTRQQEPIPFSLTASWFCVCVCACHHHWKLTGLAMIPFENNIGCQSTDKIWPYDFFWRIMAKTRGKIIMIPDKPNPWFWMPWIKWWQRSIKQIIKALVHNLCHIIGILSLFKLAIRQITKLYWWFSRHTLLIDIVMNPWAFLFQYRINSSCSLLSVERKRQRLLPINYEENGNATITWKPRAMWWWSYYY